MKKILYLLLLNVILIGCQQKRVHFNDLSTEESFADETPLIIHDGSYFTGIGFDEFENGQLKTEEEIKDGKLHGLTSIWHDNGQLEYEIKYKDGLANGKSRLWESTGVLASEAEWKDGKLHGTYKQYYNGNLVEEIEYKEGFRVYEENISEELEDLYNKGKESLESLFQEVIR